MKVLILGLGYTGLRLAKRLKAQGHFVCGSNRSGESINDIDIPVIQYELGLENDASPPIWEKWPDITHVLSTIAPTKAGIDPGWEVIKHHPNPSQLEWVGYISTTGVYGDSQGAWVDELSPVNPSNLRSQHRVNIEQQWLASDFPSHIFRLPGIYGPTRSIFERIRSGRVQHILKPGHVFSRVHVDDIAQSLHQSMENPMPKEIFNVVDDEPSEPCELLQEGCRLLEVEPPAPIPFEEAEFSPMGLSFWADCRRVSNQKIKKNLGIKLLYPSYREGLKAIFAEL